jgi:hypothetical protein
MRKIFAALLAAACLCSCAAVPLDPIASESRVVRPTQDAAKQVTVPEGMVFYNAPLQATRGLRFPAGTYALEAEDDAYWYLRATAPLEFRVFHDGKVVDARDIPGGIMIRKSAVALDAGGGYIDGEAGTKMMVWKLGGELLQLKGRYWTKSF